MNGHWWKRLALFAALVIVFNLAGLCFSVTDYADGAAFGTYPAFRDSGISNAVAWTLYALLTPGLLWIVRRFPWTSANRWRNATIYTAALTVAAAIPTFAVSAIFDPIDFPNGKGVANHGALLASSGINIFAYFTAILFSALAWQYYRAVREETVRAAELQSRLAKTEVEALRQRVQPQFVLDRLHAIAAGADDGKSTEAAIVELSGLLRSSLEKGVPDPELTPARGALPLS